MTIQLNFIRAMQILKRIITAAVAALLIISCSSVESKSRWKTIDKGLSYAEIETPEKSFLGNSKAAILKIDPKYYEFTLLCASQHDKKRRTADQWAEKFGLTAAINAGMYQKDMLSNVGYMKNFKHVNNSYIRKDYKSIFAFNPRIASQKKVQILDISCQNLKQAMKQYKTVIQNIRMIDCRQKNVWEQQDKQWSIAAIAVNKSGEVLFIHSRSPYSVHDFNNFLLKSGLNIYNAMYVEGGPEASLYISDKDVQIEKMGSYETGFTEHNKNAVFWPVPNVIGIKKK